MNASNQITSTGETYREKATRKFKENPFVPVGALATTAALIIAMVKMRRGESRSLNNWLRVRVLAQGLTIVAVVAGTYTFGTHNTQAGRSQAAADAEQRKQERLGRESREFEERLRAAEAAHRAETGEVVSGSVNVSRDVRGALVGSEKSTASVQSRSSSGWWPWSSKK